MITIHLCIYLLEKLFPLTEGSIYLAAPVQLFQSHLESKSMLFCCCISQWNASAAEQEPEETLSVKRVCVHPAAELRSLESEAPGSSPAPQAARRAPTCGCWDTQPQLRAARAPRASRHRTPCQGTPGWSCLQHKCRVLHRKAFRNAVISFRSWTRIFQFFFF